MTPEATERRVFTAELRDVDTSARTMSGLAAPYNETVPIGGGFLETLAPGCFKKSISEAARSLPLLSFHDNRSYPVGKAVEWEETSAGLVGTWQFDSRAEAQEAARMAADGIISGLSVGFYPIQNDITPGTDTEPGHVLRKEARLLEVSLVPTPAFPSAQIMMVRTAGIGKPPTPHKNAWREWADNARAGA